MIHVIARIEIKDGKREAFLEEFRRILPTVRGETGCLEYGPAIDAQTDIDRQQTNPNMVTVIEKWHSLDTLKDHLASPHMLQYREQVKDLVVGATLNILEPT